MIIITIVVYQGCMACLSILTDAIICLQAKTQGFVLADQLVLKCCGGLQSSVDACPCLCCCATTAQAQGWLTSLHCMACQEHAICMSALRHTYVVLRF